MVKVNNLPVMFIGFILIFCISTAGAVSAADTGNNTTGNATIDPTGSGSGSGSGWSSGWSSVSGSGSATVNTVPMKNTGVPLAGFASAIILIGSGLALSRKK